MTRINDLDASELAKLARRVRKLETMAGLGNSSISRGALEVRGAAGLVVTGDGGMTVQGSAQVTGELAGSGELDWTGDSFFRGPTEIEGACRIEGPLSVLGAATIEGTLAVQGATTLTNQLTVSGIGKIIAGLLEIAPNFSGGGAGIRSTSSRLGLAGATNVDLLANNSVNVTAGDGMSINVPETVVSGVFRIPGVSSTTSAANARINPTNGSVQIVSSSERFKDDIQPLDIDPALLEVRVVDWLEVDDDSGTRIAGMVAERVEEAGGAPFVEYDADGQVMGLAYDRLALARTQLLADQNRALRDRVTALEQTVDDLMTRLAAPPTGGL